MTVARVFAELEAWFAANAPRAKEVLQPGATSAELAALERALGTPLPPELRELLEVHDGQRPRSYVSTVDGCTLLTCKLVGQAWSTLAELLDAGDLDQPAEAKDGKVKPVWWSKRWIPFAEAPGGDLMCVDLDPAPSGSLGQVLRFFHDQGWRAQAAPSLETYLASYLAQLRQGKFKLSGTGGLAPS